MGKGQRDFRGDIFYEQKSEKEIDDDSFKITGYLRNTLVSQLVAQKKVMMISINITSDFAFFSGGELYDKKMCTSKGSHHSVLLAGQSYPKEGEPNYWIIQNTWGKGWGEGGYAKIPKYDYKPSGAFNDKMSVPPKNCFCGGSDCFAFSLRWKNDSDEDFIEELSSEETK